MAPILITNEESSRLFIISNQLIIKFRNYTAACVLRLSCRISISDPCNIGIIQTENILKCVHMQIMHT